jgi:uncharacterized protein YqgV (UPF0045/DUF77 family)
MLQEKIRSYEERLEQADVRDKTVSQRFDFLTESLEELKKKTVPPSPAIEAKLAEVLHLTTRISELSEEVDNHIICC